MNKKVVGRNVIYLRRIAKEAEAAQLKMAYKRAARDNARVNRYKWFGLVMIAAALFLPQYFSGWKWTGFCIGLPLSLIVIGLFVRAEPRVASSYTPTGDYYD